MAIINQSNILNLQPGITAPVVVHMSEGDVGTKLSFKLIDGARAWTDPGNVVAAVHGRRQDGTQFGPYACTISGDVVSFETDAAIAAVAGSGIAQIVLTDSDQNTAGTANFAIMVERATFPMGVTYTNDKSVYEAILRYVQTIPAQVTGNLTAKIDAEALAREAADVKLTNSISSLQDGLFEEVSARTTQDAVLSARMDEFTKLPDGSLSTAADAELADVRVMANGTTAATAGDAVREQVTGLKSDLDDVVDTIYNRVNTFSEFVQGTRYADRDIANVVVMSTRCTTEKVWHLRAGDVIAIGNIAAGTQSMITGTKTAGGTYSSGWKTTDFAYTVVSDGVYAVNVSKTTATDQITPSDITTVVTITDNTSRIYAANKGVERINTIDLTGLYGINEPNIFTLIGATQGKYINDSGVEVVSQTSTATDYIPVESGKTYSVKFTNAGTLAYGLRIHEYGSDGAWIRRAAFVQVAVAASAYEVTQVFATGNTTKYIRMSFATEQVTDCVIVRNAFYTPTAIDNYVRNIMQFSPERMDFFATRSKNLLNPEKFNGNVVPYPSGVKLATRWGTYSGTGFVEVEEGETYTISGTAFSENRGGVYFGADAQYVNGQTGISTVTFFRAVDESGWCFTVPENQGIKYVALYIKDTNTQVDGKYTIDGTYQMEQGEIGTEIVPYDPSLYLEEKYIYNPGGGGGTDVDDLVYLPRPTYDSSKIANFRRHWYRKDKDLMVCGTGTSITSRGVTAHTTERADAPYRPPLLDLNNFSSLIWDVMKWDDQQYRRFDVDGFFTETGAFETATQNADWDDSLYRKGVTRLSTGACSVSFDVPDDAWQFNFIYRTDGSGSEACSISIAEGNGKMEVFNGSAWVDANGYTFSMRQNPVILPSVTVPRTSSDSTPRQTETLTDYQIGGNTTYQKRLKMRCKSGSIDSIGTTKTVTISSASGHFMYWGVEWSPREFMITYNNSARGSHNISYASEFALQHYQDNDIWSFKPDLIFSENPVHNSGGGGAPANYKTCYFDNVSYDFFFNPDNPISLVSRADANGIDPDDLEWVIFNTSMCWNFGGITDDGHLKVVLNLDGFAITGMDAQMLSNLALAATNKGIIINAVKYWVDSCFKLFGDLKTATVGSGKTGNTLTDEGSHWNDKGSRLFTRCIEGVFDFFEN